MFKLPSKGVKRCANVHSHERCLRVSVFLCPFYPLLIMFVFASLMGKTWCFILVNSDNLITQERPPIGKWYNCMSWQGREISKACVGGRRACWDSSQRNHLGQDSCLPGGRGWQPKPLNPRAGVKWSLIHLILHSRGLRGLSRWLHFLASDTYLSHRFERGLWVSGRASRSNMQVKEMLYPVYTMQGI